MFVHIERSLSRTRTSTSGASHNLCVTARRAVPQPRCVLRASGNHYEVLGVPETATLDDIKSAFRQRAKELHPDVNTEVDAAARFKECSLAYEVLGDIQSRQSYDLELRRNRQCSMGNFFQDVDFEDDDYIDLDEWRQQRRESYMQPEPASTTSHEGPGSIDEVLRDPSQFLDRLNSDQFPGFEEPPNKLIEQLEQVLASYGEDANFREFVATYRHDPRELQYLQHIDDDDDAILETSQGVESDDEDCDGAQDEELGAWLQSFGVQQDAASFVQEMSVMSGAMQIASCALCFYCVQSLADCDAGEALRMTAGLGLGYVTRMSVKVEHLLYPLYNDIVNLLAPTTSPFISGVSKSAVKQTLESTGYLLFLLLFIPQCMFHMDSEAAAQLIGCWALAWILSDVFNIIALFIKANRC